MNLVPNKQLLLNVPFQSTNDRKKEFCVDNKLRETIGDVYCPTFRNEKCVYISATKTTRVYDCKKCKACCGVLNILFKDQKPTIILFGGDGTHCFARKTSRDYKKEKPSPFWISFLGDGSVENPIVLDEEEIKENTPPLPTTPESVRPTEPPRLQRSRAFGARMENVPDYVFRNLFH